uniref:Retroviral polymerase SH3-like domain-containing protein n=1 Tax=Megaselia scalaris TaxID=36166 RepID=T1GQA8_MEGSC
MVEKQTGIAEGNYFHCFMYETKGYRFFEPKSKKVDVSRNASFLENKFYEYATDGKENVFYIFPDVENEVVDQNIVDIQTIENAVFDQNAVDVNGTENLVLGQNTLKEELMHMRYIREPYIFDTYKYICYIHKYACEIDVTYIICLSHL